MKRSSTLLSVLLSLTLVSAKLVSHDRTTGRPRKGETEEGRKSLTKNRDRQHRSVSSQGNPECQDGNPLCVPSMLKVFDFSADIDHEPDNKGEYTSATLDVGPLPESFTICSAITVDAWTTEFGGAQLFSLLDDDGDQYGGIYMFAADTFTQYEVMLGPVVFDKQVEAVFFPLQWSRVCLSLDSIAGKLTLVVDGQLLGVEEYRREEDEYRPTNISLVLGYDPGNVYEESSKIANLNVFSSSSVEKMVRLTRAGDEECGAPGDLASWGEAEWTLHSQAKLIEVDREWDGPCRRESEVQVFTADFEWHHDCMQHCQKISNALCSYPNGN